MAASYGLPLEFTSDQAPSRHEKSLGLLTTKFVTLLQEAKDGVLDLKVVSEDFIQDMFILNLIIYLSIDTAFLRAVSVKMRTQL